MNLYGMTDIGQRRETNQDVFYTRKCGNWTGFAVVCDGMGGQNGGHIASDMACSVVSSRLADGGLREASPEQIKELVVSALSEANLEIYRKSNLEPGCKGMGTTAVVAVVSAGRAYAAHIGDSRLYLLDENGFRQVTRDHSLVQEMVDQGKLTPEEMRTHPSKNMITRAVGVALTVDVDYLEFPLSAGAKLLLCSDGLTNMVEDAAIGEVLRENKAEAACEKLIELANAAGGTDNITVAIIE